MYIFLRVRGCPFSPFFYIQICCIPSASISCMIRLNLSIFGGQASESVLGVVWIRDGCLDTNFEKKKKKKEVGKGACFHLLFLMHVQAYTSSRPAGSHGLVKIL